MRTKLIVLLILQTTLVFSQDKIVGRIYYQRILNFEDTPMQDSFVFLFSQNKGYFLLEKDSKNEDVLFESTSDEDFSVNMNFNPEENYAIETNLNTSIIYSRVGLIENNKYETYIVTEKIEKIPWVIENDYKQIGNLSCQKAIADFRGRKYTVWFTKDIPVTFGPWKLQGLPGLILEAVDETNEVQFYALHIAFPITYSKNFPVLNRKNFKTISLEESRILQSNQERELVNLINSKLPRGATFTINESSGKSIELNE